MKKALCLSLALLFASQPVLAINYQSTLKSWLSWSKSHVSNMWGWAKENPKISLPLGLGAAALTGLYLYKKANGCDVYQIGIEKVVIPARTPSYICHVTERAYAHTVQYKKEFNPNMKQLLIKNQRGNCVILALDTVKTPYMKIIYYTNNPSSEMRATEETLDANGTLTLAYEGEQESRIDYFVYFPKNMAHLVQKQVGN